MPIITFGAWIKFLFKSRSFNSVYKNVNLHKHLHTNYNINFVPLYQFDNKERINLEIWGTDEG